jgi:hypothetical protein
MLEEPKVYKLYLPPGLKLLLGAIPLAFIGIFVALFLVAPHNPKVATAPFLPGRLIILVVPIIIVAFLLRTPHRITLAPDGTIEFLSLWGRRLVRAEEIRSIKPAGAHVGWFLVRTDRGRIGLLAQFDGFHDFLTRLEGLHPGVELRGC